MFVYYNICVELEWDFVYQPQHQPYVNSDNIDIAHACVQGTAKNTIQLPTTQCTTVMGKAVYS